MTINIKKLHSDAIIPKYQSPHASGADIYALLEKDISITHGGIAIIPTGLSFEIPTGYEVQIRARSGLASKGLIIPNAPGTIDADYRGEIKIILLNMSGQEFIISPEMRIAQMIIAPTIQADFILIDSLSQTKRGDGGFGSTGAYN